MTLPENERRDGLFTRREEMSWQSTGGKACCGQLQARLLKAATILQLSLYSALREAKRARAIQTAAAH
jgi:hypothetical protein